MLISQILAGLIVAAGAPEATALNKIDLPFRRTFTRSTGEVNGPALLRSLQQTLDKYHSKVTIPGASSNASLSRRLVTESLMDEVEEPDFDVEYYGPIEVGSGTTQQSFTVQFDTGSADLFIPGPQCTTDDGCDSSKKYDEGGKSQGRTTSVEYGTGYAEGNDYTDTVTIAGLTATNQGLISLTQVAGFDTSVADGLLGMGFTSLAASGFTTFFENLIMQDKVAVPEFSFYLGRAASGTSTQSTLCLGCRDPSRYKGSFTQVPVTQEFYWQVALDSVNVDGMSAGGYTSGQAIVDTGTTLVLAPTAAAAAIFMLVPESFPISLDGSSDQTFYAYPCSMPASFIPTLQFSGRAFSINPADFNFGTLTSDFARLLGDEALAVRLDTKGQGAYAADSSYVAVQMCVAAIVGTDVSPQGDLFVVGDPFLKNWYTTFSYAGAGGQPSVSFAQAV